MWPVTWSVAVSANLLRSALRCRHQLPMAKVDWHLKYDRRPAPQIAALFAPDAATNDTFGGSVALTADGGRALIGSSPRPIGIS